MDRPWARSSWPRTAGAQSRAPTKAAVGTARRSAIMSDPFPPPASRGPSHGPGRRTPHRVVPSGTVRASPRNAIETTMPIGRCEAVDPWSTRSSEPARRCSMRPSRRRSASMARRYASRRSGPRRRRSPGAHGGALDRLVRLRASDAEMSRDDHIPKPPATFNGRHRAENFSDTAQQLNRMVWDVTGHPARLRSSHRGDSLDRADPISPPALRGIERLVGFGEKGRHAAY